MTTMLIQLMQLTIFISTMDSFMNTVSMVTHKEEWTMAETIIRSLYHQEGVPNQDEKERLKQECPK